MDSPELDRYEREVALRVGVRAARELRRELETHLEAEIAIRVEGGENESAARSQALASLGDLRASARAERPRCLGLGRIFLFVVPWLPLIAFVIQPRMLRLRDYPAAEVYAGLWSATLVFLVLGTVLARRRGAVPLLLGVGASSIGMAWGMSASRMIPQRAPLLTRALDTAYQTLPSAIVLYVAALLTFEWLERREEFHRSRRARG